MPNIPVDSLKTFAADLLARGGYAERDAREMADLLVWANCRGVDSHGVLRIPRYVEMLSQGEADASHVMTIVHGAGAVRVLDAGKAPGAVAMNRAVREAVELARHLGLGWCAVKRTSHAGAIGYFVEQVARGGLIGVAMTASKPLMSYHGAKGEALSTNPLAIAIPAANGSDPIILDISTAAVALGRVMAAKDAGRAIPKGWAIDADGADTTDPRSVAALLPMAGAKGSGLSLMIEVLCSVVADNPNIAPALTGGKGGGFNGMVLAVDPGAFGDPARFAANVASLASAIQGLEPATGIDRVRLPGQRGYEMQRERDATGITLAKGTAERLIALAEDLGAEVPELLRQ